MQTEEMIGLMTGQNVYDNKTLSQLSGVIEEYPYFQAAHLLSTLNFLELKDTRFSLELRKTTAYLGDRRNLFYLIEKQYFIPEIIKKLEEKEETVTSSSFELIDLYLADKEKNLGMEYPSITTDYISHYLSEETEKEQSTSNPMQHQETIDKFLKEDEISPMRLDLKGKEDGEIPTIPSLETVDENSFFSETLAKIYLKQKKYDRALVIIRKLNLIYPEKNRYFADQIRFLEKLIINSQK
jgi:tetratricopeptide (TPR) repeat protein